MPAFCDRDKWLQQDDAQLLAACEVDVFRGPGPGQKRNKTRSSVRLRHSPSGLVAQSQESRSQHRNKALALRRLRRTLALEIRERVGPDWTAPEIFRRYLSTTGRIEIAVRNFDYPRVIAVVLDVVVESGGVLRDAADLLGITSGQLSRFVASDEKVLARINQIRRAEGLRPITR
ncbi:MAG: peptide chain release factor family protein [Phycisphaerae bacterium]